MADKLITWDEKEPWLLRPDIPANQKFTYTEANLLKEVVNDNALKLPFLKSTNGSGIITGSELVGIDVGSIKGENIFMAKDKRFKKEVSDDTIYDMDGVTPFVFTPDDIYELTPNNTK